MDNSRPANRLASQLLQLDEPLNDSQYKEYRMSLETALTLAQRREKRAAWVAGVAFAVSLILMFVGGSEIVGDFDPWSPRATFLSSTLGVIYFVANIVWPVSLASYFARFRPKIRDIKEQIRDTSLLALHSEIAELRKQVGAMSRRDEPA